MPEVMHPDAPQDESLIMEVMSRELVPIFQTLKQRIEMLEQENCHLKELTGAIIDGFGEAVSNHRRGGLAQSIDLSDLGEVGDTYKDLEGSDLKEDLIDYIMENNIGDDELDDILSTLKQNAMSKYGKYKKNPTEPPNPEPPAPEGMGGDGKGVLEVAIGKSEEPSEEPEQPPELPMNSTDAMFKKVMEQNRSSKKNGIKL